MADVQQKVLPSPPAATIDEESAAVQSKQIRRKTCVLVTVFIATFLVVDALLFVALDLTLLRVESPNYRLQSVTIENLRVSNSTAASPSFGMQVNAQVTLRNRNFGPYEFYDGYLTFSYGGKPVGEAVVTESRVKLRSTKTMGILVNVTSKTAAPSGNQSLGKDIESGLLRMTAVSNLRGQVKFVRVFPKDKSAELKCDLTINLVKKIVQELICH